MSLHSSGTLEMSKNAVMALYGDLNSDVLLKSNLNREDFLLKKISKDHLQGNGYTVFVYGAAHDFRDNVTEWNERHPNSKYSLVVLTPKGIK